MERRDLALRQRRQPRSLRRRWSRDIPGYIGKVDANWPKVLKVRYALE